MKSHNNSLQYELHKTYTIPESEVTSLYFGPGHHFCRFPLDVLNYYGTESDQYCLVEVSGRIIDDYYYSICSQIKIIKLLSRAELLELMPNRIVRVNGTVQYYKEGRLHRLDGPAVEFYNGDKHWYIEGQLHRLDGPAMEWANGLKAWFKKGETHRLDGPAIINSNGSKEWWIEGVLQRVER